VSPNACVAVHRDLMVDSDFDLQRGHSQLLH